MRIITRTADQVRDLRRALSITQKEFAARLQVSRRTIIRGEQRGLEIPWYTTSDMRMGLYKLWGDLEMAAQDAADRARAPKRSRSHRQAWLQSVSAGRGDTQPRIQAEVSPSSRSDTHGAPARRKVSPRRPRRAK